MDRIAREIRDAFASAVFCECGHESIVHDPDCLVCRVRGKRCNGFQPRKRPDTRKRRPDTRGR